MIICVVWVTWLVHACKITHAGSDGAWTRAGHDSFMRETWFIYNWDMTYLLPIFETWHTCAWKYYTIFETWHTCAWKYYTSMWHDSQTCVWHGLFICATWLVHAWHERCLTCEVENLSCDVKETSRVMWRHCSYYTYLTSTTCARNWPLLYVTLTAC